MRKRLLSLLLAIVMVMLAVPALALPAIAAESASGSGVLYSTSFSSDPKDENFPTLDLPSADAEDATKYTYGGYDFGSIKTGGFKDNAITWNGNWVMGSLGVNWDPAITDPKAEGAAPTVDYTKFNPYDDISRATESAYAITHNNGIWSSNASNLGSGFWLQQNHYCMVGGMIYSNESPADTRTVTAYYGTTSLRYTVEYSGIINIGLIANVAFNDNGVDLVVYQNGVEIGRVLNENMVANPNAPIAGNDCGSIDNVSVTKGDVIDFVALADPYYDYDSYQAAGYSSFVYGHGKRGYCDFDFTIDYTAISASTPNSPFETAFTFGGANWPTTTYVHGAINENSYPVYGTATYKNSWELGGMSAATWNDNYYAATTQKVVASNDHYLSGIKGQWMSNKKGAGAYTDNGRLILAVEYDKVTADAGRPNSDPRNCTGLSANVLIRYTAEYAGTATVSVEALKFLNNNNGYFAILHNGERIGDFYPAGEEFSYANGTGWYPAQNAGKDISANISDIAVTLATGDTIDFIFRGNEYYDYQHFDGVADGVVAEGYKYDGVFKYSSTKRVASDYDFRVTYDAGYQVQNADTWTGSTDIDYRSSNYNTGLNYFFRWYKANETESLDDDTLLSAGQTAVKMDETCYAVVNKDLYSTIGITADTTLAEAFELYRAHMKAAATIKYSGDWTMGALTKSGAYSPIVYFGFFSETNPYMLRTTNAGVNTINGFDNQFWMTEDKWDESFDSYYNALFQGTVLNNATAPKDGTVKVGDIKVTWSTDLYATNTQGNGAANAPTTVSDAAAGKPGDGYKNPFWVRPASQIQAGAYTYKAPVAGTVKLTIDSMTLQDNATFQWALLVNGTALIEKNEVTATAMDDTASVVEAMNTAIAAKNITVNAGDLVEIAFYRDTQNKAPRVNLSATATVSAKLSEQPSLAITDSYALNLYLIPSGNPYVTEVGVLLNGKAVAGEKQENGYYKVTLKDKIKVSDLTSSTTEKTTGDGAGVSVTYHAYEKSSNGFDFVNSAATVSTGALLNNYIANGDAKTAALAKSIQALAISSSAALNGTVVDATTKIYLKGTPQIVNVTLADLRTALGLAADTPIYTKSGNTYTKVADTYKYTNYDSGANEIYLATLKMYTDANYTPTYNNYLVYTLNEDGETYTAHKYPFTPDATVTGGVNYGYAEDVDPTDASKYAYKIVGANVNMGDKISMVFLANANGENSTEALSAYYANGYRLKIVTPNDGTYYGEFRMTEVNGKKYAGVIVDVPVSLYDADLAISIVDADDKAVSAEMTYSIKAFCVRMANLFGGYGAKDYVVRSVFALGKAAKAYLAD